MPTPNLVHRFTDVGLIRMDIPFSRVHVGLAGKNMQRERVHVLRPASEAGVTQSVENEKAQRPILSTPQHAASLMLDGSMWPLCVGAGKIQSHCAELLHISRIPWTRWLPGNVSTGAFALAFVNIDEAVTEVLPLQAEAFLWAKSAVD